MIAHSYKQSLRRIYMMKWEISHFRLGVIFFLVFLFLMGCQADHQPAQMYVSDLEWKEYSSTEDIEPKVDQSSEESPLELVDNEQEEVTFEKGIQVTADTEIIYDLSKYDYHYFTAWVGVDQKEANQKTYLEFLVYVDDELTFESRNLGYKTPMERVHIDITSANTLKLITQEGFLESDQKSGIWGNAMLHKENPLVRNDREVKEYNGMKLIFQEEFDGEELDEEKWRLRTEPENGTHHYKNDVGEGENLWIKDGNLHIQAKPYTDSDSYSTTSAAISTEGKFFFRYGRIEVRAKIPTETGMWPAIWMMPEKAEFGWPLAGEIDIMELISDEPNKVWSTLHTGIYQTDYYRTYGETLTINQGTLFDDFHVFSLEWESDRMAFYIDDELIGEFNDWESYVEEKGEVVKRNFPYPFNRNFYLILNLATGGWSKDVSDATRYGERTTMLVDYVRVYQKEHPAEEINDLKEIIDYYDRAADFTEEGKEILLAEIEKIEILEDESEINESLEELKERILHLYEKNHILFSDAGDALIDAIDRLIEK